MPTKPTIQRALEPGQTSTYLQSAPDLPETSTPAHPLITDH